MALKIQFVFTEGTAKEVIVVDASVSETHSFPATATNYPVEKGAAVADNVRAEPIRLRVEALIADFPLKSSGRQQVSVSGAQQVDRPAEQLRTSTAVLKKLRDIQERGVLVDVETGLREYKNMVLEGMEVPRDKSLKNAIRANLSFKQIRIVETDTVKVTKAKDAKGQGKIRGGPKSTKPADSAGDKKSLAAKVYDSISALAKKTLQ